MRRVRVNHRGAENSAVFVSHAKSRSLPRFEFSKTCAKPRQGRQHLAQGKSAVGGCRPGLRAVAKIIGRVVCFPTNRHRAETETLRTWLRLQDTALRCCFEPQISQIYTAWPEATTKHVPRQTCLGVVSECRR